MMRRNFVGNDPKRWSIFFSTVLKSNKLKFFLIPAALIIFAVPIGVRAQLSLEDAIRLAAERSPGIQAARSDSLSGIYDLGAARAWRYPTASLTATTFYINTLQTAALPFGGLSLTVGTHNNYQADFRLSLPLWTGGRISGQVGLQTALSDVKGANLQAARLNNAYNTRKAFLGLLAAQAVARSAEASLARIELIVEDTQNLYQNGLADSVDLLYSDLALQKAIQAQVERATAITNARALLGRLIGLPSDSIIIPDALPEPDIGIYQHQRPRRDSINRAEIMIQENRVRAANFSVGLNRANYFPALSGFGGYSAGKPNRNILENKWNDYWTAGFNLSWDFNLGNRTGKAVSSARQAANSARAAKQDLEETLYLQANTAYDNLLLANRSYDIAKKEYEIAQRQYALAQQKQEAGNLSLYRLQEYEAELTSSEQLFQVSKANYFISETEYLYAIGSPKIYGGFQK
jgi:outer membrane protein